MPNDPDQANIRAPVEAQPTDGGAAGLTGGDEDVSALMASMTDVIHSNAQSLADGSAPVGHFAIAASAAAPPGDGSDHSWAAAGSVALAPPSPGAVPAAASAYPDPVLAPPAQREAGHTVAPMTLHENVAPVAAFPAAATASIVATSQDPQVARPAPGTHVIRTIAAPVSADATSRLDAAPNAHQTFYTVTTEASLSQAIASLDAETTPGNYFTELYSPTADHPTITENTDTSQTSTFEGQTLADPGQLFAFNLASGVNVTLVGNANALGSAGVLDGAGIDPGLVVYAGNVTVVDLDIENTVATGGAGAEGGGGGAGLGGGLFVGAQGVVTLDDVTFTNTSAVGGAGSTGSFGGGGEGLGGNGGYQQNAGNGGGGGFGLGAIGAGSTAAGAGIVPGAGSGGDGLESGGGIGGQGNNFDTGGAGGYGGGGGGGSFGGSGGSGGFGGGGAPRIPSSGVVVTAASAMAAARGLTLAPPAARVGSGLVAAAPATNRSQAVASVPVGLFSSSKGVR